MKRNQILRIVLCFIILSAQTVYAQKEDLSIVVNVAKEYAWNIVYQSFDKHDVKLGEVDVQTQKAVSGYYRYTNLMIDNRAKFQVTWANEMIEIQFVDRQYLSDKGWVNNLLPVTKGIKKKYIYPIAETIRELNDKFASNQAPIAAFSFNPSSGNTTTEIDFNAGMSSDQEDDISELKMRWDWQNDGVWDTDWETSKTAKFTYRSEGVMQVKMEIKDNYGFTNEVVHSISIKNYTPCPDQPFVLYKGQKYNTVLIGDQCWIQENINVGERIEGSTAMADNGIVEKYSYDNNSVNNDRYGGLYQWNELMSYTSDDSTCGICPEGGGWRIPTKNDYEELITYLGGSAVAGAKLKEAVSITWTNQDSLNSEASGFKALSGGVMLGQGIYSSEGEAIYFATSDEKWQLVLTNESDAAELKQVPGLNGMYVRCIKGQLKDDLADVADDPGSGKEPVDGADDPGKHKDPNRDDDDDDGSPEEMGGPTEEPDNGDPAKDNDPFGEPEDNPLTDPADELDSLYGIENPPLTNCTQKEYLVYLPFDEENFSDTLNALASNGYKLIAGSAFLCYFEKENERPDSIRLEKGFDKLDIETINELAEQNWAPVSSLFLTYFIKDKDAPTYEYIFGSELSNAYMNKYPNYFMGGSNIHDMNDYYGDEGWEMVFISGYRGDYSLFRREKGNAVNYEYRSFIPTVEDKNNNYKRLEDFGDAGWQYCTTPVALKGLTGPWPIILKRRAGTKETYSFKFVVIDDPAATAPPFLYIGGDKEKQSKARKAFSPLMAALNKYGQAGWKYEMMLEAHKDAYGEDKVILVFQVPNSCK
jgi:uncharacterized protein (TIGR02145 family)